MALNLEPGSTSAKNRETYEASAIVRHYARLKLLQPAEAVICDRLKDRLPNMKMLDLGIGGGRTTQHFAPLVAEYTGIDYSERMIAACREKFANASPMLTLEVGDARNLEQFANASFDFILFSFNGIDYVANGDRLKILQEVHRVGKPGAYFAFSSHNLQGIAAEFDWRKQLSPNPLDTYTNLVMAGLLRYFNPGITRELLETSNYLIIRDEPHNFRLWNYYIRPEIQIEQLLQAGFDDIEVYSWRTGKILNASERTTNADMWLYYSCVIN